MNFHCVKCGRTFDIFEAEIRFAALMDSIDWDVNYFDDDDVDCDDPSKLVLCAECKFERIKELYDWDHEEPDSEYILIGYEEDCEIPEGCKACDNPGYPMCKDSCPLFDD